MGRKFINWYYYRTAIWSFNVYILSRSLNFRSKNNKEWVAMTKKFICILLLLFSFSIISTNQAAAQTIPEGCSVVLPDEGVTEEKYLICIPPTWNGILLIFAHGYVAFNQPVDLPWDQLILPDGTSIPGVITELGFGFAATSYSTNGLAIKEGVAEVVALAEYFDGVQAPAPVKTLLAGPSEGGLITALAVEQHPEIFDGGFSTCGPIGDFHQQVNYWGDFRVVFDYFYPGLLRGSPVEIPTKVIQNWETKYAPRILDKIDHKPEKLAQLLDVTGAPFDPEVPDTISQTVERLLWYNVFATNDGVEKLDGQPFGNAERMYAGSLRDDKLNRKVARFEPDSAALDKIEAYYQTTGRIQVPLVTMHTTGDEVVPFWHNLQYNAKITANADAPYLFIPVERYGHCNFRIEEVLAGFGWLYFNLFGSQHEGITSYLREAGALEFYTEISR
jgi:pimeloyl-ACP methyl ester carboxylesterase